MTLFLTTGPVSLIPPLGCRHAGLLDPSEKKSGAGTAGSPVRGAHTLFSPPPEMPIWWTCCDVITDASTSISTTRRVSLPSEIRDDSASSPGLPRTVSVQRVPASCAFFAALNPRHLRGRRLFVPGGKMVQTTSTRTGGDGDSMSPFEVRRGDVTQEWAHFGDGRVLL